MICQTPLLTFGQKTGIILTNKFCEGALQVELTWLGRYKGLVHALVHHSNCVARKMGLSFDRGMGVSLNSQEFQLLEAVIEHEDETLILSAYSALTGISRSSLTFAAKKLESYALVERYKFASNKKNIILRPTEKGKEIYRHNSNQTSKKVFAAFFDKLSFLTDDQLEKIADAIMTLDVGIEESGDELIKQ